MPSFDDINAASAVPDGIDLSRLTPIERFAIEAGYRPGDSAATFDDTAAAVGRAAGEGGAGSAGGTLAPSPGASGPGAAPAPAVLDGPVALASATPAAPSAPAIDDVKLSRNEAVDVWRSIGQDFVRLRASGRSQAWAALEDKVAEHSAAFIAHGLISAKDLVGMLIDIEQFRKQEQGTQQAPGDWLSDWLRAKPEDAPAAADAIAPVPQAKRVAPPKRATARKSLSPTQKARMTRNLAKAKETHQ